MSSHGNEPPHDPYAQQPGGTPPPPSPNPYGASQPPDYSGQPPVQPPAYGGASAYGAPGGYGPPAGYGGPLPPYSHWGKRVGAYLIDYVISLVLTIPAIIGFVLAFSDLETTTDSFGQTTTTGEVNPAGVVLIVVGVLLLVGFWIWNRWIKQGRTGYTVGKGVLGIKLVGEADGQPIGAGKAFVRDICHFVDGLCYIGYLWPLWDAKRQTFADKILSSLVVDIPKP